MIWFDKLERKRVLCQWFPRIMNFNVQINIFCRWRSLKTFHIISNNFSFLSKERYQLFFKLINFIDLDLIHVYRLFTLFLCPYLHHLILRPSFDNSYPPTVFNPRHLVISPTQDHFRNAFIKARTPLCLLYPYFDFDIQLFLDITVANKLSQSTLT